MILNEELIVNYNGETYILEPGDVLITKYDIKEDQETYCDEQFVPIDFDVIAVILTESLSIKTADGVRQFDVGDRLVIEEFSSAMLAKNIRKRFDVNSIKTVEDFEEMVKKIQSEIRKSIGVINQKLEQEKDPVKKWEYRERKEIAKRFIDRVPEWLRNQLPRELDTQIGLAMAKAAGKAAFLTHKKEGSSVPKIGGETPQQAMARIRKEKEQEKKKIFGQS